MSFHFSPKINREGLLLYLDAANVKSYPGSGTLWKDLSNNKNDGTLVNSPTFVSDNFGGISFDGANSYVTISDNYGNLANPALNFGTGDFTILVWVNGVNTYPGFCKSIIFKGGRFDDNLAGWSMTWAGYPTDLYFIVSSYTSRLEARAIPNNALSSWSGYKLVGITRSNGVVSQINNGVVTYLGSFNGDVDNNYPIYLSYNAFYGQYLSDIVSNLQIYNRALSESEILQNYNSLKGRFLM